MRLGILGGTFDPVHLGHLIVAEEARERLGLHRVLFVPAGQPWLKASRKISPASHRLEMLRLAVSSHPEFEVSTLELDRPGPTYTVDTVAALSRIWGERVQLFFVLGWDSLADLPRWDRVGELVSMVQLVAVPRPGAAPPDLEALEKEVPGIGGKVLIPGGPLIGISASDIRRRVAEGRSIRYLVPEAVERYIAEHRLYRER